MPSFSQRQGLTPIRSILQHDSLDEETRVRLWNVIVTINADFSGVYRADLLDEIAASLWEFTFLKPADERRGSSQTFALAKDAILAKAWHRALDVIDDYVKYLRLTEANNAEAAPVLFNMVFERCLVSYRFIAGVLVPVGEGLEGDAIVTAIESTRAHAGARHHILRAIELLSDRNAPDYLNSIKESISAVEAVVTSLSGERTIARGLSALRASGRIDHAALESAWSKMYGWTSDAEGIRHAASSDTVGNQAIAKYMVVACSAFVTYLVEQDEVCDRS